MPIHLITGLPGDGKTTTMMHLLLEAAKKGDRPLFASGIDGLKPGLATVLQDATKWQDCPDGSLIFVDEAWRDFGHLHNPTRQATPAHVLALAEHRHRGFDFVWTTQAPSQIYPFARALIGEHWHVVRKFGTTMQDIYKWGELTEDVKSQTARDRAVKAISTIKADTFEHFKSASEHTIKPRLPWKLLALPLLLVAFVVLLWVAFLTLRPGPAPESAQEKPQAGTAAAALSGSGDNRRERPMSLEEYLAAMMPLAPGLHGSQPIFGRREAQAVPRVYCIIGGPPEASRCACYTEQVTPLYDITGDVCRHMARWGEYDPFRPPMEAGRGAGESPADAPSSESTSRGASVREAVQVERAQLPTLPPGDAPTSFGG